VETVTALQRCLDEAYDRMKEPQEVQKEDAWMQSGDCDSGIRDVLWECRPDWSAQDLQKAVRKLKIVGIVSTSTLSAALASGLNEQLRKAGLKPFCTNTIKELDERLSAVPTRRSKSVGAADDGFIVSTTATGG